MKIGIDIDAVLSDTMKPTLKYLNKKYGTNYTMDNITSYYFEDWIPNWTRENSAKLFLRKSLYKNTPVIKDSLESVLLLAKNNFEIEYITARDKSIEETTHQWIYKNGFPHRTIVLFDKSSEKVDYIKNGNFDIIVEDKLQTLLDVGDSVFFQYLIDYPWNQYPKNAWITRVKGWNEIIENLKLWGFIK